MLAAELNIPLLSLNAVCRIDLAIDGADEVDPGLQLIKGGGACHVQEKLVAARADRFVVVVDSTKLVDRLNLGFLLPVEVLPGAWRQVKQQLEALGGSAELRMAQRKAGPVVTDQGNLVLDAKLDGGISDPVALEQNSKTSSVSPRPSKERCWPLSSTFPCSVSTQSAGLIWPLMVPTKSTLASN